MVNEFAAKPLNLSENLHITVVVIQQQNFNVLVCKNPNLSE